MFLQKGLPDREQKTLDRKDNILKWKRRIPQRS